VKRTARLTRNGILIAQRDMQGAIVPHHVKPFRKRKLSGIERLSVCCAKYLREAEQAT
jgi:hypothetical protein